MADFTENRKRNTRSRHHVQHRAPLLQHIAAHRGELIAFAAELVRIPSIHGNETEVARCIQEKLRQHGIRASLFGPERERKNLVADIGRGTARVLLNGHLDTVPFGNLAVWKDEPLSGAVRAGKLFGRGAYDMKSAVAAAVFAAIALKDTKLPAQRGKLRLVFNADEESLLCTGIREAIARGYTAEQAIVGESTRKQVLIGARGCWRFELEVIGKSGHTARPQDGANAVTAMAEALLALEKLRFTHKPHRLFAPPCISPGTMIEGGSGINIIPAECRATVDIRLSYGMTLGEVRRAVRDCLAKVKHSNRGCKYRIREIGFLPVFLSDRNASVVESTQQAIKTVLGYQPSIGVMTGGSDANVLAESGVPCAIYGVDGGKVHAENEFARCKSIVETAQIYALATITMLQAE